MNIWDFLRYIICLIISFFIDYQCPASDSTDPSNPQCPFYQSGTNCQDECGVTYFEQNQKIVGGSEAVPYSWPAQILLEFSYTADVTLSNGQTSTQTFNSYCGGTLIDRSTVLTAAHCILQEVNFNDADGSDIPTVVAPNSYYPTIGSMYTVGAGIYSSAEPLNRFNVSQIIMHESYDPSNFANDIAIVKLAREVELSEKVQIACLPDPQYPVFPVIDYGYVWAVGWGATSEGGAGSENLKNVQLNLYNSSVCGDINPEAQICAGEFDGGKDTCQGDSGGPLYYLSTINGQTKYMTIGVVSYGPGCARPQTSGVYTRISYYQDWIAKNRL